MGPMTGRAAGYCVGYAAPGFANPVGGRGFFGFGGGGFGGRGAGRGQRNRYRATGVPGWAWFGAGGGVQQQVEPASELDALKQQAAYMEETLGSVKKRIEEIGKEAK